MSNAPIAMPRPRYAREPRGVPVSVPGIIGLVLSLIVGLLTLAWAGLAGFGAAASAYQPGPEPTVLPEGVALQLRLLFLYAALVPMSAILACLARRAVFAYTAALLLVLPLILGLRDPAGFDAITLALALVLFVLPAYAFVRAAGVWNETRARTARRA